MGARVRIPIFVKLFFKTVYIVYYPFSSLAATYIPSLFFHLGTMLCRPILRVPPATPRTPARRGRSGKGARDLDTANMADSYFEAQSGKVGGQLVTRFP